MFRVMFELQGRCTKITIEIPLCTNSNNIIIVLRLVNFNCHWKNRDVTQCVFIGTTCKLC